jgi:hypothetical protein
VVDEQHAAAVLVPHRADDRGEVRHLGLGQAGRGLVHEHELRLGRERAGDAEPPLVAVRERRRGRVRVGGKPEDAEEVVCPLRGGARRRADAQRGDLDVLAHRQVAERVRVLEGAREPRAAATVRRPARDVAAVQLDGSARRPVEARQHVHERRLAGAVRPDQPDDLAAPQLEADPAQRLHALERP